MGDIKDMNGGFGSSSMSGAWRDPIIQTLSGDTNNIAHNFGAYVVDWMVYTSSIESGGQQVDTANLTNTDLNNANLPVAGTITNAYIYLSTK